MHRTASHAGSWYEGSGSRLTRKLDDWLDKADVEVDSNLKAIIAPHAGYYFCGSCAAHAYKKIDPQGIKRIFIMGPSHHVHYSNCVLSAAKVYETPLYNLKVDEGVVQKLRDTGLFDTMSMRVDEEEHSLEMQLPFIARMMEPRKDDFTIVPMLVGSLTRAQERQYGKLLSHYFSDPHNLFVISSDFCHWGERFGYTYYDGKSPKIYKSIEALDRQGMDAIESMNGENFNKYLKKTKNTICGRHSIAVMIEAAGEAKKDSSYSDFSFKFHNYKQSSQVEDWSDSSVSYASGGLTAVLQS